MGKKRKLRVVLREKQNETPVVQNLRANLPLSQRDLPPNPQRNLLQIQIARKIKKIVKKMKFLIIAALIKKKVKQYS